MRLLKTVFYLFFIFGPGSVGAQQKSGEVIGVLQDSATNEPIMLATVTVFRISDSSVLSYRLTNDQGRFRVPGLPLNEKLRVLFTFSGFSVVRRSLEITSEKATYILGEIKMVPDVKSLQEVLLTWERPPVLIRKDTIEFVASAFKTLPSALLEDLFKKLPGFDIDFNGNMKVNGRKVNKLLVDGKDFFDTDSRVALKNLPANIIDKVQVMDDKEQLLKDPDVPVVSLGLVINLRLKAVAKRGWLGKVYGGLGNRTRYEAGAVGNIFKDTTQLSILGYGNNINRQGFGVADLKRLGGFDRSGGAGVWRTKSYQDGSVVVTGNSFGGLGQGVEESLGGGFNFNHLLSRKMTLNVQYFYGEVENTQAVTSNGRRYISDTVQFLTTGSDNRGSYNSNRLGTTLSWKPDSLTTIMFKPSYSLTDINHSRKSTIGISENIRHNLYTEELSQTGNGKETNYKHEIVFTRNFRKNRRTLTVISSINEQKYSGKQYYRVLNSYPFPNDLPQRRATQNSTSDQIIQFALTEPLSESADIRIQQKFNSTRSKSHFDAMNQPPTSDQYSDPVDSLSRRTYQRLTNATSTASLVWRKGELTSTMSFNWMTLTAKNAFLNGMDVKKNNKFFYPGIDVRWKNINASYNLYVTPPSTTDLEPVVDNSNRQFHFIGNPELEPTVSSVLGLSFYKFFSSGSALNCLMAASIRNNAVIRQSSVDGNGIQTTTVSNVNGIKSLNLYAGFTKRLTVNHTIKLSVAPSLTLIYNDLLIVLNNIRTPGRNLYTVGTINFRLSCSDMVELSQSFKASNSATKYSSKLMHSNNLTSTSISTESELTIRFASNLTLENIIIFSENKHVAPDIRKQTFQWSPVLTYSPKKINKTYLRLSAYDLLNQNIGINRIITDNSITDSQQSMLGRYFMLTVIRNIGSDGTSEKKIRERSLLYF